MNDIFLGRNDEPKNERLFRRLYAIRRFEESVLSLFDEGVLSGTTHACIGQEADAVGVLEHVRAEDLVFSNHRCHGHYLARTGDVRGLLAEMMGKPQGVCKGVGGSQHLFAEGFQSSGILGGLFPVAAGSALALKMKAKGGLGVAFIGDGTLGEGVVYETLNIVSLWKIPLFIVLEDNGWAQSTPKHLNTAGSLKARFEAFGLPVTQIATTDVTVVEEAAGRQIEFVRSSQNPSVLAIETYRLCHHSKNDDARPKDEVEARWANEPLRIQGARIPEERVRIISKEVDDALKQTIETLKGGR